MQQDNTTPDSRPFVLGERIIDTTSRCYIAAEMSANHHQSLTTACELIYAMKEAGADAVKLQTYTPDSLTIDSDLSDFRIGSGTAWEGKRLYQLYQQAMTPWEWHGELFELAKKLGLDCFSSPFDRAAVDFLEPLNPIAYKIASFELVDLPLIEYVASQGRPVIISTGMASLEEISQAVAVVKSQGAPLALLKCTSAYPAPVSAMNLRTIPELVNRFGVPVGLSDHSFHVEVAVTAVALGARIIEKHFTLSREQAGPDSGFSLEPHEFRAMVKSVRMAEQALGEISFAANDAELACRSFRRSLYAVRTIVAGEPFTLDNVRSIRPASGLPPQHLPEILKRTAACNIPRGTPLTWEHCR
jgi:pseudaminic acid synthase